jgi:hypothetical protein
MKKGLEEKSIKTVVKDENFDSIEFFKNSDSLALPKELKEQITAQGYVYRWLNEADFRTNNMLHRSGWLPYNTNTQKSSKLRSQSDVEGLIRRGDLILGVRPVEFNKAHADAVRIKNKRMQNTSAIKADEFQEFANRSGVKAKVFKGYDEN